MKCAKCSKSIIVVASIESCDSCGANSFIIASSELSLLDQLPDLSARALSPAIADEAFAQWFDLADWQDEIKEVLPQ